MPPRIAHHRSAHGGQRVATQQRDVQIVRLQRVPDQAARQVQFLGAGAEHEEDVVDVGRAEQVARVTRPPLQ